MQLDTFTATLQSRCVRAEFESASFSQQKSSADEASPHLSAYFITVIPEHARAVLAWYV